MIRAKWLQFGMLAALWCAAVCARGQGGVPLVRIDAAARGTPFNPGVRGMALDECSLERAANHQFAIPQSLQLARGSSLRGVSGGLYAELYDWRTRNGVPSPTTLEFLRQARDARATPFITVNSRGLARPDPGRPGNMIYTTTDTAVLAALARDWVRYANHVAPTCRQGDAVSDSRDATILQSLRWRSDFPGDAFDTLPARGEPAVPRVEYWEIGNEPTESVSQVGVTNGFSLGAAEYARRYKAIAAAMKAEDPAIKVGPCVVRAHTEREHLKALLGDPAAPVDFISYHPYGLMGAIGSIPELEACLAEIERHQRAECQAIRDIIAAAGRNPATIELVASETNISNWTANETGQEARMAHALGTVEAVFTYARLGLRAAHYWIWPAHSSDGTRFPVTMAFEMLRDHLGDTLLAAQADDRLFRFYATRSVASGELALWGLNFSNDRDVALGLIIDHLPEPRRVRQYRLASRSGRTTLESANLSPLQPGGPRAEVDWQESEPPDQDFQGGPMTFPAATITVLVIESAPEHAGTGADSVVDAGAVAGKAFF